MDSASRALTAEDIEAHQKWVRSLARGLLTEVEADDRTLFLKPENQGKP